MNSLLLLGRISLFIIYFWFGILKVLGLSPAEPLVHNLFDQILGTWMDFPFFNRAFGLGECLIGVAWLIPSWTKSALILLLAHMGATFLPVFLLPNDTWQNWFTPTLVGQYILKNFGLISLGSLIFRLEVEKVEKRKFELS